MTTFEKIQGIIADTLGVPANTIRPESKAIDLQGWDSVSQIIIITAIEEAFDFRFSLDAIGGMDSVQKLMLAIEQKDSQQKG